MGKKVFQKERCHSINQDECRRIMASHTLSEQGLQTSLGVHLHPEEDRVFTTMEQKKNNDVTRGLQTHWNTQSKSCKSRTDGCTSMHEVSCR